MRMRGREIVPIAGTLRFWSGTMPDPSSCTGDFQRSSFSTFVAVAKIPKWLSSGIADNKPPSAECSLLIVFLPDTFTPLI
jgi:hypothetical protein